LPKIVRDQAGISPGDIVEFQVVGPHKVMVEVIPVKPLEYFWAKFASVEPYDDDMNRKAWQDVAAAEALGE
jgi:bifunctional DNA-binding transcriptional regulator/antitoxin component of YhaV-PrlF toxin-antitoxin module